MFGSDQTYPPMDAIEREAWMIAVGITQGGDWDESAWCWKKKG